jgi:hypothetical protein
MQTISAELKRQRTGSRRNVSFSRLADFCGASRIFGHDWRSMAGIAVRSSMRDLREEFASSFRYSEIGLWHHPGDNGI